jgi:hypothetical protein
MSSSGTTQKVPSTKLHSASLKAKKLFKVKLVVDMQYFSLAMTLTLWGLQISGAQNLLTKVSSKLKIAQLCLTFAILSFTDSSRKLVILLKYYWASKLSAWRSKGQTSHHASSSRISKTLMKISFNVPIKTASIHLRLIPLRYAHDDQLRLWAEKVTNPSFELIL